MCTDSMIKKALNSLCCNNGWCYGVFWGFDQTKSLIMTLKDAYYEEQMGALIDSMLLQAHVLGGGVIGQVAFTENHLWMYSDTYCERLNSSGSFETLEVFQDDSDFYSQFCLGIKTIALISVEHWGVVQFGSTKKILENKDFVDQVKKLFKGINMHCETKFLENEPLPDCQFVESSTQFSSVLPSQSFPSSSNHPSRNSFNASSLVENLIQIDSHSTHQFEQLLLSDSGNLFDCSTTQQALSNNSDCSVLTSSWPYLTSEFKENAINTQNLTPLIQPTYCKAEKPSSGLLTLDDMFQESEFAEAISRFGLEYDISQLFSPQQCPINASFTTLLNADPSHTTGLIPLSSLTENNSPIQSSVTDTFKSNPQVNCSTTFSTIGVEPKKPPAWSETLIPVRNSNSLFSKLGIDHLLDGSASTSTSFARSGFEDHSSSASKRRKVDNFLSTHEQVKNEDLFSFDGNMNSLNPVFDSEKRIFERNSEASTKEPGSSIGESCIMGGGNTSSSKRQSEPTKNGKKKAKPGTKPRPKDRQMIQDRLAELRELIPSGEKMSIDRLLERTIRHLNYMQSITRHAESMKQIVTPKNMEIKKNQSSKGGGGVTWACEVGDQSMVCPLIVEDLNTPGQMRIEILCEEQGFFLEIVDVIRSFGLIVLKGVMELREQEKIWAHFMVEAEGSRRVSRHEIFSSLIQLLQQSAADPSSDNFGNVISSSFNNCQPAVSFPVDLTHALQCANL